MKTVVIGDADTVLAFGLAGIRGEAVGPAGDVAAILERLSRDQISALR